jgi:magnesium chelatase family protein
MNPPDKNATASDILRYERKISGPIMDRIDMWVTVDAVDYETLSDKNIKGEKGISVRDRVIKARQKQLNRFATNKLNSEMNVKDIEKHIELSPEVQELLNTTAKSLGLSARVYHRVIKLAQTIADLEGSDEIKKEYILEALQYRPKKE